MILQKIIENKRIEVERAKRERPLEELSLRMEEAGPPKDFFEAIHPDGRVKIIAEIKRSSPSRGILREHFNPTELARAYGEGGASAVSVLTDGKFFSGDLSHLREVKDAVEIPVLRKDFIIDSYQLYESRLHRADAVLLIASVLDERKLIELLDITHSLLMNAVVEVHDEEDLGKALLAGARIIGINNRNLKTFDVSLDVAKRLSRLIPKEKIVVAESGIGSSRDIKTLREEGILIFLIGETLMKAISPEEELGRMLSECN